MGEGGRPLRVALMNDFAVVVAGLRAMLEPFTDRVRIVELDSQMPVVSDVDVVLYDAYSRERVEGPVLDVISETDAPVVIYTWSLEAQATAAATHRGAAAVVSKELTPEELVEVLERVASGESVVSPQPDEDVEPVAGDWPGRDQGLTARQSEVLALIAMGLTNDEVAQRAFITLNSLKSHIRTIYRKIGVERRSQAVVWAVDHGFRPDRMRRFVEDA